MSSTRLMRVLATLAAIGMMAAGCRGSTTDETAGSEPSIDTAASATEVDPSAEPVGDTTTSQSDSEVATDFGVTEEACPETANEQNGCIYLGTVSDLTEGPFVGIAEPLTAAQAAFWNRVNEDGGIGGYDVDVTTYVRDNKYNPETHNQVYREIKDEILAVAQTLGSPTTAAIIDDVRQSNVVSVPASWTSGWLFEDVVLEAGSSYCYEAMNFVDYAADELSAQSIMAVHYPGDAGDDGAVGARMAAEARGLTFLDVPTAPGAESQGAAIDQIVAEEPDAVVIITGPGDAGVIVGQSVSRGFDGMFMGSNVSWTPALLDSNAADALDTNYMYSTWWGPFSSDTPGHEAMRDALGDVEPDDSYVSGWVFSYALRAAIEQAVQNGDVTRAGLLDAATSLQEVDYEGILPESAGNFSGEQGTNIFKETLLMDVDADADLGSSVMRESQAGPTATETDIDGPCYLSE